MVAQDPEREGRSDQWIVLFYQIAGIGPMSVPFPRRKQHGQSRHSARDRRSIVVAQPGAPCLIGRHIEAGSAIKTMVVLQPLLRTLNSRVIAWNSSGTQGDKAVGRGRAVTAEAPRRLAGFVGVQIHRGKEKAAVRI